MYVGANGRYSRSNENKMEQWLHRSADNWILDNCNVVYWIHTYPDSPLQHENLSLRILASGLLTFDPSNNIPA